MNVKNGYEVPVKPGSYRINWGGDDEPFIVMVEQHGVNMRVTEMDDTPKAVGWVEREPCSADNLLDYVRVLRDNDTFTVGSNGYYVEFSEEMEGTIEDISRVTMVKWLPQ